MKLKFFTGWTAWSHAALTGLLIAAIYWSGAVGAMAQNADAHSPNLDQIVKLTKAQMTDDVIINYVRGSGTQYNLSADDLLYLKSEGVSQPVISALLQTHTSAAPAAQPPPAYAPQEPAPTAPSSQAAPDYQPPPAPSPADAPSAPPPAPVVETRGFLGIRLPGLRLGVSVPTATVVEPAPPPPPDDAPAPEPAPVNYDYFHDQLQPYGVWESTPDYGWVWYPGEAAVNPDWRPYNDGGHWAYSDQGWMWQSDYPWGDVVFHYGRWTRMVDGRWAWVPAYDWAPAWVAWRHVEGDAALGWAPLPPGAEFRAGVGLWWHGGVALDVDFGLGADYFTFVPFDHFWDHDFHRYVFDRDRDRFFYGRSVMRNGYGFDHGRFRMEGLGRDRMAALTHHDVRAFRAGDLRREEEHRDIGRREEAHPEIRRANLDREKREGYTRQPERAAARPGEARPGEARPGEARPGEARPGETRPGETRPGESRPGETAGKPGYGTAAKPPAKTTSQPGKSGGESNSKEKKPD